MLLFLKTCLGVLAAAGLHIVPEAVPKSRDVSSTGDVGPRGEDSAKEYSVVKSAWLQLGPEIKRGAKALPTRIFWLHMPKCGTTFLKSLAEVACPDMSAQVRHLVDTCATALDPWRPIKKAFADDWKENCDVRFVNPSFFHDIYKPEYQGVSFGMFRKPMLRIISGYHFDLHRASPETKAAVKEAFASNSGNGLVIYASARGAFGVQTKFLLGFHRHKDDDHDRDLTGDDIKEATRTVTEDFAYVGLTDEWAASVMLFHGMFGGGMPASLELSNFRNTNYTEKQYESDIRALRDAGWEDPYDGPVFESVRFLMEQRVRSVFGSMCAEHGDNSLCQHFVARGFLFL